MAVATLCGGFYSEVVVTLALGESLVLHEQPQDAFAAAEVRRWLYVAGWDLPAVHCAIAGIKSVAHIEDAAGALGRMISREDWYALRQMLAG